MDAHRNTIATFGKQGGQPDEEARESGDPEPVESETGARDQFQLYEILYAAGESAGVAGKEQGARWRQAAIEDGVLPPDG